MSHSSRVTSLAAGAFGLLSAPFAQAADEIPIFQLPSWTALDPDAGGTIFTDFAIESYNSKTQTFMFRHEKKPAEMPGMYFLHGFCDNISVASGNPNLINDLYGKFAQSAESVLGTAVAFCFDTQNLIYEMKVSFQDKGRDEGDWAIMRPTIEARYKEDFPEGADIPALLLALNKAPVTIETVPVCDYYVTVIYPSRMTQPPQPRGSCRVP